MRTDRILEKPIVVYKVRKKDRAEAAQKSQPDRRTEETGRNSVQARSHLTIPEATEPTGVFAQGLEVEQQHIGRHCQKGQDVGRVVGDLERVHVRGGE